MYPLAVALAMMFFFREKKSFSILFAVVISLIGAALLSSGEIDFKGGNTTIGLTAAICSVFFYGGYIIGVRKSRAVNIPSTALTAYVMGLGALFFIIGGCLTSGIRLTTDGYAWLNILGLALPATAISNITLVKAIKHIGPTLTSIFGALGTTYCRSHRMLGIQRKFHGAQCFRHSTDTVSSDGSGVA